jgi:hypothetical protein
VRVLGGVLIGAGLVILLDEAIVRWNRRAIVQRAEARWAADMRRRGPVDNDRADGRTTDDEPGAW